MKNKENIEEKIRKLIDYYNVDGGYYAAGCSEKEFEFFINGLLNLIQQEKQAVAKEIFDVINSTRMGKAQDNNGHLRGYYMVSDIEKELKPLMKKYKYEKS